MILIPIIYLNLRIIQLLHYRMPGCRVGRPRPIFLLNCIRRITIKPGRETQPLQLLKARRGRVPRPVSLYLFIDYNISELIPSPLNDLVDNP